MEPIGAKNIDSAAPNIIRHLFLKLSKTCFSTLGLNILYHQQVPRQNANDNKRLFHFWTSVIQTFAIVNAVPGPNFWEEINSGDGLQGRA